MLELIIPTTEVYQAWNNRFVDIPSCVLTLEHSLISVAKWESKWHIPYLNAKKTTAQELDYIRCMAIGPVKDDRIFSALSNEHIDQIRTYIDDVMTATTFSERGSSKKMSKEIVTAEILYYRMFINDIPMECQKWHLNRLLTLIRVCDTKNSSPTKMNKRETASRYAEQNALRKAKYNTKG